LDEETQRHKENVQKEVSDCAFSLCLCVCSYRYKRSSVRLRHLEIGDSLNATRKRQWDYNGAVNFLEVFMRADQVEASWDPGKNKWLLRICVGEEVIRRYCSVPRDAQEEVLKSVAQKTLQDEGYEPDPTDWKILR
jgi:hypothetical protein